jgi:tetratricopeptide (TPR) repeat protein
LWFDRGLALAEQQGDRLRAAQFYRDLGVVALHNGDLAIAQDRINRAKATFQDLEAAADMAFTMNDEGLLDVAMGRLDDAIASYQEALGWLGRARRNLWLEVSVKINLANALMEMGRFPEATEQLREGEEMTIVHNFTQGLAQIYVALGKLCRHHVDENGFVFFEKALELSRAPDTSTILEGEIYFAYGVFRSRLGHREDAAAHLKRARLIFDSVGDQMQLTAVVAEIERLQA